VVARLVDPSGAYLRPSGAQGRGRYGELCLVGELPVLKASGPRRLEVEVPLPGVARLLARDPGLPDVAPVLEVELEEWPLVRPAPAPTRCPVCCGALGRYEPTCDGCGLRVDDPCWAFLGSRSP